MNEREARLFFGMRPEVVMFRNNVGKTVRLSMTELNTLITKARGSAIHGDLLALKSRGLISYGLGLGSSDLIGIGPGGRFCAVELKDGIGRESEEQRLFRALVEKRGGAAVVARDERCLEEFMSRLTREQG